MRKLWKSVSKIMLAVLLTTQIAGSTGILLVQAEEEEPIEAVEQSEQVEETESEEEQEEDADNSDESDEQELETEESTEEVYEEDDESDTEEQVTTEDTEEELTVEPVAISLLSEEIDEEIQSEEAVETTTAAFYVLVRGGDRKNLNASNYISLGKGKITDAQKIYDDYDEIKEHLYEIPSISKLELTEDEEVRWYSIKKETDGWHVDGEIVNDAATDEEPQEVELPYENLDDCDMMDFSNWRSGCYHWDTGKYMSSTSRVCLNDYKKVESESSYYVVISDADYHILVREMNQDGKMLVSHNLKDGDKLEIDADTAYVGVGIYNVKGTTVSMEKYSQMFSNGFMAILSSEPVIVLPKPNPEPPEVEEPEILYEDLDDCDMMDFSNWRSGCYNWESGKYMSFASRICLNDYKKVESGSSYYVMISDTDYHILVREMNVDGKMLVSHNLKDGDKLEIGDDTRYVGVGIYNIKGATVTMKQYSQMFADGFMAVLSSTPQIGLPKPPEAEESKNLEEELKKMIETGDTTVHDVSRFNIPFSEAYMTFDELIKEDCYLAYHSSYGILFRSTKDSQNIVQTIWLEGIDNGFLERYEKMQKKVPEILEMISNNMNDIEKALIFHDYVVENTEYSTSDQSCSYASGSLINGRALCAGYTNAMLVLLHEAGIEAYYMGNGGHAWVFTKLDGEWFHMDPTWDDTRTRVSGQPDHLYFVRNDSEFRSMNHNNFKSYECSAVSTSTSYTDWFIHDIAGKVLYSDGFWYYAQGTKIMKSKWDGTEKSVIKEEASAVTIKKVENGKVTYTVNGNIKTVS